MKNIKKILSKKLFWVIVFCTVPVLLILLAKRFHLGEGLLILAFIIVLIALHFIMPVGKSLLRHHATDQNGENKSL